MDKMHSLIRRPDVEARTAPARSLTMPAPTGESRAEHSDFLGSFGGLGR